MIGPDVAVVPTAVANLASVRTALERLGVRASIADAPATIDRAGAIVLPGVGAFGAAMASLRERGLTEALRRRIDAGRPTLAICVGLQALGVASEESPGSPGLGVIDAPIVRLPRTVRTPQMGWNRVEPHADGAWPDAGHAYFANSYCLREAPPGWEVAWAEHGVRFVACMRRAGVLACQFHPELSGAWGRALLASWLAGAREEAAAC